MSLYKDKIIEEIEELSEKHLSKIYEIIHIVKLGLMNENDCEESINDDELLDIESISVETGIKDLAENHDYYLYGVKKE